MSFPEEQLEEARSNFDWRAETSSDILRRRLGMRRSTESITPSAARIQWQKRMKKYNEEARGNILQWIRSMHDSSIERLMIEAMGMRRPGCWRSGWRRILEWDELAWELFLLVPDEPGEPPEYCRSSAAGGEMIPPALEARIVLAEPLPVWVTDYPPELLERDLSRSVSNYSKEPRFPTWQHSERACVLNDAALAAQVCRSAERWRRELAEKRGRLHDKWLVELPFTARAGLNGDKREFQAQLLRQTTAHHRFARTQGGRYPYITWPFGGKIGGVLSIDFPAIAFLSIFRDLRPESSEGLHGVPDFDILDA